MDGEVVPDHGPDMVEYCPRALAVLVLATLVISRLGNQCAAILLFGVHRVRHPRQSRAQNLRSGW